MRAVPNSFNFFDLDHYDYINENEILYLRHMLRMVEAKDTVENSETAWS